jgi:hypothetical protein
MSTEDTEVARRGTEKGKRLNTGSFAALRMTSFVRGGRENGGRFGEKSSSGRGGLGFFGILRLRSE